MVQNDLIERVSRGLCCFADAAPVSDPDLVVAAIKAPSAVVCLISALAFHELTTQIPHRVDLALPPGARTPKLDHPPIQVYRSSGRSMTEGVEEAAYSGIRIAFRVALGNTRLLMRIDVGFGDTVTPRT